MLRGIFVYHGGMSEFKSGESMRVGVDARRLTPDEDTLARRMADKVNIVLAAEIAREAVDEEDICNRLLLTPFAMMYALHAAMEGARAVPPEHGRPGLREAVFKRE